MKKALALTLITALLFSALAGTLFVNLTTANPMGLIYPWDPKSKINILLPQNNTSYPTTNLQLTFAFDLSEWYDYSTSMNPSYSFSLGPIEYYLDGVLVGQITGHLTKEPYNLTVALSGLTEGLHSIEVNATTSGEYWHQAYTPEPTAQGMNSVTNGSSGLTYFTVKNVEPFPTAIVAAASGASVAVIGIGLLVYFKKRKH